MSDFTKTLIVDGIGGGGKHATIQSAVAVSDIQNYGGVIIVEEYYNGGDYYEISSSIEVPDNVTIIGRGSVVLCVTGNVTVFKNDDQSGGNSRIRISGFKILADRDVGNDLTYDVIHFMKTSNCRIENITIGVESGNVSDISAIHIQGSGTDDDSTIYNTVSQCVIDGYPVGIEFDGLCNRNVVDGNSVTDCDCGIKLNSAPKTIMSNNIAYSSDTYHGIHLLDSDYVCVTGNAANANTQDGIRIEKCKGCSVQNNVCNLNAQHGIHLTGVSGDECQYNTLSGNVCSQNDNGGSTYHGIYLDTYTRSNSVVGNNCSANGGEGIEEAGSNTEENIFVGNNCCGNSITSGANSSVFANNIT